MNASAPTPDAQKPKLTWYEHIWLGWPIALLIVGGAIGGACGGAAWAINQKVFRAAQHPFLRYFWTGLISIAAIVAYFILAAIFLSYFPKHT